MPSELVLSVTLARATSPEVRGFSKCEIADKTSDYGEIGSGAVSLTKIAKKASPV